MYVRITQISIEHNQYCTIKTDEQEKKLKMDSQVLEVMKKLEIKDKKRFVRQYQKIYKSLKRYEGKELYDARTQSDRP